jgi:hypothetical protein
MYCKKCKFHSFDHVSTCPKCGADWEETRKSLYLNWLSASGVSWLAKDASPAATAAPSKAQGAGKETLQKSAPQDYLTAPMAPPAATAANASIDSGIDVSSFPELEFAMPEAEPAQAPKVETTARSAPAPKLEEDLFLEPLPAEDTVELDFSASFDTPAASKASVQAKPKREDLFIPELEEMLAPLEDEPRTKSPAPKKSSFSEEQEILLDFGTESPKKNSRDSNDELSFLSLEDPKKP